MKKIFVLFIFILSILGLSSCDINLDINMNEEPNINDSKDEESTEDNTTQDNVVEDNPTKDGTNNDNISKDNPTNDNTDENISDSSNVEKVTLSFDDYYSSLSGILDIDFKEKLHALTESMHKSKNTYKYAWTVLEDCDEDPNNTNNIICFYTGQSIPKTDRSGSGNGTINWNREHVWPKSLGFKSDGAAAHNDCHHLHATEEKINNYRGNKDFGEVDNPTNTDSYGNKWNSQYFEPRDDVKGDVARSILYMVVRYDGDKCDDCVLDLELVNGVANTADIINNQVGRIGDLATLLKWHYEDPVSDVERKRNEVVYGYQGNRNPFIDHEEFVSYLYTSLVSEYTDISKLEYLMD